MAKTDPHESAQQPIELSSVLSNQVWILAGVLLIALNLRLAIGSVLPLLETIRTELGLGHAGISLLITIPVLCMGVFALGAAVLSRQLGRERTIYWAVFLVGAATLARFWSENVAVLFGSTLLVGVGIAISQTLLPSIVSEFFRGKEAFITGLYTASLIGGAGLASITSIGLENVLGSWPAALSFWGIMAIPAILAWRPVAKQTGNLSGSNASNYQYELPWQNRWAWCLALYYGGAAVLFFSSLTWVAPRYENLGWSIEQSGLLVTVLIVAQLAGALIISVVGDFTSDRRPWFGLCLGAIGFGIGAIALIPLTNPWIWTIIIGLGDGGLFALVLLLPVDYSSNADAADQLSSFVLSGGYVIGAIGPFAIGWARDVSENYSAPFLLLVGLSITMLVVAAWFRPNADLEVL